MDKLQQRKEGIPKHVMGDEPVMQLEIPTAYEKSGYIYAIVSGIIVGGLSGLLFSLGFILFPKIFGFVAEILMVYLPPIGSMYLEFTSFDPFIPDAFLSIKIIYGQIMAVSILITLGIIINTIFSRLQDRSSKRLGIPTLLKIGIYTGGLIGFVRIISLHFLAEESDVSFILQISISWVTGGFLMSLFLAQTRNIIKFSSQKSFSAPTFYRQMLFLFPFALIMTFMSYGEIMDVVKRRELSIFGKQVEKEHVERDLPEGLKVISPEANMDKNGDLIITGLVNNSSTINKSWFLIADVYGADNTVLARGRVINGRQIYSPNEYEILTKKRNIPPAALQHHEQILMPKNSADFEMRIIEPPAGIKDFTLTLQPVNYDQLASEDLAYIKASLEKFYKEKTKWGEASSIQKTTQEHGSKDRIDRLSLNVDLGFRPADQFPSLTKQEILEKREYEIDRYKELELYSVQYTLDETIFGQIDEHADWLRDTSLFILNPYLLVIESAGEYVNGLFPYCPASSIVYSLNMIKVQYKYESANKWMLYINDYYSDSKGVVRLWFVNALDAGFKYAHVDASKSVNIEPVKNAPDDHVMRGIYSPSEVFHLGRSKKNNISPNDGRAKLKLKDKGKTLIYIKLWKDKPDSINSKEDFTYVIEVLPKAITDGLVWLK